MVPWSAWAFEVEALEGYQVWLEEQVLDWREEGHAPYCKWPTRVPPVSFEGWFPRVALRSEALPLQFELLTSQA